MFRAGIIVAIFLVGSVVSEESSKELSPPLSEELEDLSTSGSTTISDESSSSEESSIDISTTTVTGDSEEGKNGHPEEPKLPVDLLSRDILLDPSIVLARVTRQLGPRYSTFNRYDDHRQLPVRRNDEWSTSGASSNERNDRYKRFPLYPVFPGRK